MRKYYFVLAVLLILGGLMPVACGSTTPASPTSTNPTDTYTPNPPTVTPTPTSSPTNTPTNTATTTVTNTPTVTATNTIVFPVGTFAIGGGVNPPVSFTVTNNSGSTANLEIALYPYPGTGSMYWPGGVGPISSGAAGASSVNIPGPGNYFVYYRVYISGSYTLFGWIPMYIAPGYNFTGSFTTTYGTLQLLYNNNSCLGCGLP